MQCFGGGGESLPMQGIQACTQTSIQLHTHTHVRRTVVPFIRRGGCDSSMIGRLDVLCAAPGSGCPCLVLVLPRRFAASYDAEATGKRLLAPVVRGASHGMGQRRFERKCFHLILVTVDCRS